MVMRRFICVLIVLASSIGVFAQDYVTKSGRMDRNRLNIGVYHLRPYARTEAHIKDLADCGVDFVICMENDRPALDLFSKYGVGAIVSGVVPGWWGGDGDNAGKLSETNPISKYEEAEKEAKVVEEVKKQSLTSSKPVKEETTTETKTYNKSSLSDSEIYMLAQLIYLEGGNTSYECQLAIGSVVLNLMRSDGVSLKTEIYTPGRFSVASSVAYTTPSETSLKAARYLANNGTTLPSSVKCFRNNHYFNWCTPYMHLDNVYFGSY